MDDDELNEDLHPDNQVKLRDVVAALVTVTNCRCLRCDYRWRESSLIFRTTENAYSWDQNYERLQGLANGSIPISGRRLTKRTQGACQNCVKEPKIRIWESDMRRAYPDRVDTQTTKSKARRGGPDPQAQALISHLLDL